MRRAASEVLLLIDGYNAIGGWPKLIELRDRDGLQVARRHLIEVMFSYIAYRGFDAKLVFDAHYQDTPGNCESVSPDLTVCYTNFGQTADSYIEQFCAQFKMSVAALRGDKRLLVATSDRDQQMMVRGYGAECMSVQQLMGEIARTNQQIRDKQRSRKRSKGRFLFHSLDAEVQQRLADLRRGAY